MKNSIHLDAGRHPFGIQAKTPRPKLAHMAGIQSKPGGVGNKISANAAMRKKRPMQGPGTAT